MAKLTFALARRVFKEGQGQLALLPSKPVIILSVDSELNEAGVFHTWPSDLPKESDTSLGGGGHGAIIINSVLS